MTLSPDQVKPYLDALADELGASDRRRLTTLLRLLGGADHRSTAGAVCAALFDADASASAQSKALQRLREQFNSAAAQAHQRIRLEIGSDRSAGAARAVWFDGEPRLNLAHRTDELDAVGSRLMTDVRGLRLSAEPRLVLTEWQEGKPLVRWFASYAHASADARALIEELKLQLRNSAHYCFQPWSDQDIVAGEDWEHAIRSALAASHLGLLLVDHAFLASGYITAVELPTYVAGAHPSAPGKRAVPVALERIDFDHTDLRGLGRQQIFLDGDGKAYVERSKHRRKAWVGELVKQMHELLRRHADAPPKLPSPPAPTRATDTHNPPATPSRNETPFSECLPALKPEHMLSADLGGIAHLVADAKARQTALTEQALVAARPSAGDDAVDVLQHLLDWLREPAAPALFALLGEYGMGKTITCQRLVRAVAQCRLNPADASDAALPTALYFDLRQLTGLRRADALVPTLARIVDECIARGWQKGVDPPSAQTLIDLGCRQPLLWVFDGLDEALVHLNEIDGQAFTRELLALQPRPGSTLHPGTRVLLSCRTHYFRSLQAQNNHFTGQQRDVTPHANYRALLMLPLDEAQIRAYFAHALPSLDADATLALVRSVHNLSELAERPFTLRLVTEFIPQIEQWRAQGRPVYGVTLYRHMVQAWLGRDAGKHHLGAEHKPRLMAHLAAWLWQRGQRLIAAADLEPWFHDWLDSQPALRRRYAAVDRDKLEEDLRTATFLVREDGAGNNAAEPGDAGPASGFRFAHSSMQEYFLAEHLLDALQHNRRADWALPLVSAETRRFLQDCLRELPAGAPAHQALAGWRAPYLAQASEQWLRLMLDRAADADLPLPHLAGADLHGAHLHGWSFIGRSAQQPLNLSGADFSGCELRETVWRDVRLDDARLDHAALHRCEWWRVTAPRLRAHGSHWDGAALRDVAWPDADLAGSTAHAPRLHYTALPAAWLAAAAPLAAVEDAGAATAIGCTSRSAWERPRLAAGTVDAAGLVVAPPGTARWLASSGHLLPTAAAVSPDGTRVVSGGRDGSMRVWDVESGLCLATWTGHRDWVAACGFRADGARVVSASGDGTLRVWDVASGTSLAVCEGHEGAVSDAVFTPDGRQLVSAASDDTLRLWDAADGRCVGVWTGHTAAVCACTVAPDGQHAISASGDKSLRWWDIGSGRCLSVWHGHTGGVSACAISPNGARVVSASNDKTLRLWDAATGQCLAVWRGHSDTVTACAFSPDGQRVVSNGSDGTLHLWDTASGQSLTISTGQSIGLINNFCALFADGQRIAAGGSVFGRLGIWDASTGQSLALWPGSPDLVRACQFSADGQHVVSATSNGKFRVWDSVNGTRQAAWSARCTGIDAVACSPDGRRVVFADSDGTLRQYDAHSGRQLLACAGHTALVNACAFSPNGLRIASASSDHTLRLWDAESGQCIVINEHTQNIEACAFSPDGQTLISAGWDGSIGLWRASTGDCLSAWTCQSVLWKACAFFPDGRRVLLADFGGHLRVWDVATGTCAGEWSGHTDTVDVLAFAPDGRCVVSASRDSTLRLWDAESGTCLQVFTGHLGAVKGCAFSPDGHQIVSAGSDGTLRLWDAASGACLRVTHHIGDDFATWTLPDQRLVEASEGAWRWLMLQHFDDAGRLVDVVPGETLVRLPYTASPPTPSTNPPSGQRTAGAE